MRFAHFGAEDHPSNIAAKQFASRVESRTNGEIKIIIFPNNVLGGPPEQAQQIKLGTIDMGLPTQGQLDKYDTAFAAVVLPFIFDSREQVFRVLDGPAMTWLAPLAEEQGFILLRNWDYGFRNVTNSVRPINAPEDVKGLKLRTPPELQIQASMEALGATRSGDRASGTLSGAVAESRRRRGKSDLGDLLQQILRDAEVSGDHPAHLQQHDPYGRARFLEEAYPRAADDLPRGERRGRRSDAQADRRPARRSRSRRSKPRHVAYAPNLAPFRALMGPAYERIAAYAGADNVKKFQQMAS